jgi:hypothetical protein
MTATCAGCGVTVTRDDDASAWTKQEVWYDADRVDLDVPAVTCEKGDSEGEPHKPITLTRTAQLLLEEFEPEEDHAILFCTAADEHHFSTDFDPMVKVAYIRVPLEGKPDLVLGIDDELNTPGFYECIVYATNGTDHGHPYGGTDDGFDNFLGGSVEGVGHLSDIPRAIDPTLALQGWLYELDSHGYDAFWSPS